MKNNPGNMSCLDFYLSSLNQDESKKFEQILSPRKKCTPPLLCWDIFMEGYHRKNQDSKKQQEIRDLIKLSKKFKWKNNPEQIAGNNFYDALVITDLSKTIIWVSDGFTSMTGYPKTQAINHSPVFLQGPETSEESKNSIRRKIKRNKPFKEVIINYRKDKTPYKCELKIFPLAVEKTTHFLALEREIA